MSSGIFGVSGNKMARPLAFTPVAQPSPFRSMRGLRGLRGLGGALGSSNIPGNCWDVTGFKDCHGKAYAQAQSECAGGQAAEAYGGDMDMCIERNADAYAWAGCVGQYCPPSKTPKASGATSITWRNTTPNATVSKLQAALNVHLKALGANTLLVDGLLGSGTCGAAYWVDGMDDTTYYTDYGLPGICKATTMPTKKGTKTPVQTVQVAPQTTITKDATFTERSDLPWEEFNEGTVGVQQRLNVQLDATDMNAIDTAGKLNAATCGAMKWAKDTQGLDLLTVQGVNCQGFTAPTKRMKAATPVVIPSASPIPQPIPQSSSTKMSAASMATTGLVVGAVGLVGWWYGKKHGWFG